MLSKKKGTNRAYIGRTKKAGQRSLSSFQKWGDPKRLKEEGEIGERKRDQNLTNRGREIKEIDFGRVRLVHAGEDRKNRGRQDKSFDPGGETWVGKAF